MKTDPLINLLVLSFERSRSRCLIAFAFILLLVVPADAQALYKQAEAPFKVATELVDLHDAERDRDVPVKVYAPVGAEGPRAVVLISHGLGGSREGLSYLGEFWASHGYVCIVMQHLGSDEAVWKDLNPGEMMRSMRRAVGNPQNAVNRAYDVTFVLDQIEAANGKAQGPLHGEYDMDKVAIAGHSFGAWTCLAAGGMTLGGVASLGDKRIKCMIPLSSPAETNPRRQERAYASIKIPALHVTGTLDESVINNSPPEHRRIPYDHTPGPADGGGPQFLINFDGADHMTFSGETGRRNRALSRVPDAKNKAFHAVILHAGLAFLDAYLFDDADALIWLNDGGMKEAVERVGTLEAKAGR